MQRKVYSSQEIETFKKEIIDYNDFKYMDRNQQAELLLHYEKQFNARELGELFGVKSSVIHSLKYQLKKDGYIEGTDRRKKENKSQSEKSPNLKKVEEKVTKKEKSVAVAPTPIKNEVIQYPAEYLEQFNTSPVQVINPSGDDLNVSLEEFMKMLEIQEKMAKMMEEQSKQKNHDGFQFKFKGDFTSQELTKRLNKILAVIEDEPFKYAVKFELYEMEEETDQDEEVKNELLEEVNHLQVNLKELQNQLEEQKRLNEKNKKTQLAEGYQTFTTSKKGLHHPRSEYEKSGEFSGTVERDGRTLYQTFYICKECNHKGKHFLEIGTIYCNCQECGKRMRIRTAVKDEKVAQDSFGNYFIAGKFKRADEIEEEKPLFELWGAK